MTTGSELTAIERLANLRERGMLTADQFEEQKARILSGKANQLWIPIFVGATLLFAAIAGLILLLNGQSPPKSTQQFAQMPSGNVSAAVTPLPRATPPPAPIADPDLPRGRGKVSSADPIAQSASVAEGLTPQTTFKVDGKKVTLFRHDSELLMDSTYVLMVGANAEVLEPEQLYSIEKAGNYVVLASSGGGTACPGMFQIIDVAGGRISDTFGTCSDLIRSHMAADGSLIAIVHRFNVGGPVTARYSRGTLTVWGEP